jgi:two-component system, sporulation sensor kinase B
LYVESITFLSVIFILGYLVIQTFSMWLIAYSIETMKSNVVFRETTYQIEKLKIVSELAASVSHEVRNPLTVVSGFIQMLREFPDLSADKRSYYLDVSLDELRRAQSIISDYLTFAKPDLNQVEILEVKEELKYVINVISSLTNMNEIEIQSELLEDCRILGDRQKLRQCLINLAKNSVESMENGGLLKFRMLSQLDGVTTMAIQDTGTGMTQEQISRLGTPYYSTKDKGTGLGTMVAFSIIQTMGGKFEIQSEPGMGTCITIHFPKVKGV